MLSTITIIVSALLATLAHAEVFPRQGLAVTTTFVTVLESLVDNPAAATYTTPSCGDQIWPNSLAAEASCSSGCTLRQPPGLLAPAPATGSWMCYPTPPPSSILVKNTVTSTCSPGSVVTLITPLFGLPWIGCRATAGIL